MAGLGGRTRGDVVTRSCLYSLVYIVFYERRATVNEGQGCGTSTSVIGFRFFNHRDEQKKTPRRAPRSVTTVSFENVSSIGIGRV